MAWVVFFLFMAISIAGLVHSVMGLWESFNHARREQWQRQVEEMDETLDRG